MVDKDKRDEKMPVYGSDVDVPARAEPKRDEPAKREGSRRAEEGREGLAEPADQPRTWMEEYREEHPVPLQPVGEVHKLSTDLGPEDVEPRRRGVKRDDVDEVGEQAARVAQAGRDHRSRLRRAVAVHHQLGEIARGQGAYPGEILALHTTRGQDAMLRGVNNPGAREALENGSVEFEANVIRAAPQGMASRYDPNED